jgi:hypothetical protein
LEADLPDWGSNGVNLIRTWWQSYSSPILFGYPRWDPTPTSAEHMVGHQLSWALDTAYPDNEIILDAHVKLNTDYKISVYVKTNSLVGTGVVIRAYNPTWKIVTTELTGTNDWTEISVIINSYNNYLFHTKVVVEGCTSGSVWVSNSSIREDLGGGSYGPELVERTDPEVYRHFPQLTAWRCEKMLDLCEANNVWLKIVVEEKQDPVYGRIMSDGSYDDDYTPTGTSLYANATSANRCYQEYYWRFLAARFGHSPAVHSWELFNEADPFNGNHYEAANTFAKYMHDNNPNRQLVTTSNWHSYPTSEFWANSEYPDIDYSDLHKYNSAQDNYSGILNGSGQAAKIVNIGAPALGNSNYSFNLVAADGELTFRKLPVMPGHQYRVSVYTKADSIVWIGGGSNAASAAFWIREFTGWWLGQSGFHAINTPSIRTATPLSYDWTQNSITFSTESNTHFLSISAYIVNASSGTAWYDGITIDNLTTGKSVEVPNGCFEYADPVCWDSALETYEVGSMYLGLDKTLRHMNAPLIRGETGISDTLNSGNESPLLFNDTANLWLKKKVWAQIGPSGVIDMPWWREKLDPTSRWAIAKTYCDFMSNILINNGHYNDIAAVVSNASVRVYGQKDTTNNRAHFWVDNALYTWKAVLDHNYPPLAWAATWTFTTDDLCSNGSPVHIFKSLQAGNINHATSDTDWWSDEGAYNVNDNPALPSAVSGNVTISDLADGSYTLETWDTSTGTISSTETVTCTSGAIVIPVANLVSDVAFKLYEAEAPYPAVPVSTVSVILHVDVVPPAMSWNHGKLTNVYANYEFNAGVATDNIRLQIPIPQHTSYVVDSASAGGSYSPDLNHVYWSEITSDLNKVGTKSFQITID